MEADRAQRLRQFLAELPRAAHHQPGERVALDQVFFADSHRPAIDPERSLIIGNRGMGKSFWSHALLSDEVRREVASRFRFPGLEKTKVFFGFNGSERQDSVAPTPAILDQASRVGSEMDLWRAVLVRAICPEGLPARFDELVGWVAEDAERCAQALTRADDALRAAGERRLLLFDALDRLSNDASAFQARLGALLRLTVAAQSYRSLRLKLFLRSDQYENPRLFAFPDGAKVHNTAVLLKWSATDLYELLFRKLEDSEDFAVLEQLRPEPESLVSELAGEFMGANAKRGRVFSWLPTHLADARGDISPRTFLTVWREAAIATPRTSPTPVNPSGIQEGVRKTSADRLAELGEDYPWVKGALEPLRGLSVPLERSELYGAWRRDRTLQKLLGGSKAASISLEGPTEESLEHSLQAIGVIEVRLNGKVNVPDIFRVEARIKRKGGVKPPHRGVSPFP